MGSPVCALEADAVNIMNQQATSKFSTMPRTIQWLAVAAVAVLLFLVWDTYLEPWTAKINTNADITENNIREIRSVQQKAMNNRQMEQLITTIGPVRFPESEALSSAAAQQAVNSLLAKHGALKGSSFSVRSGVLPRKVLEGVATARLERLTGDLKFEATPEKAAAIIAELEASPNVEAITSLRMTKDTGGKVKVNLALEAWVEASGGPRTTGATTS